MMAKRKNGTYVSATGHDYLNGRGEEVRVEPGEPIVDMKADDLENEIDAGNVVTEEDYASPEKTEEGKLPPGSIATVVPNNEREGGEG